MSRWQRMIALQPVLIAIVSISIGIVQPQSVNAEMNPAFHSMIVSENQMTAKDFLRRGNLRYGQRDFRGAIEDYNQAIKLNPDDATAYYNRGVGRSELEDKKGAIEDYNQAIKLKPDYVDAYSNRGVGRSELGDKKGAIEDYQKAADLFQAQGNIQGYQKSLEQIKML